MARRPLIVLLVVPIVCLSLTACGNPEPPDTAAAAADVTAARPEPSPRPEPQGQAVDDPGICALVSGDEVAAAFGGRLTFDAADPGRTGRSCRYPIREGVDGNALVFAEIAEGKYGELRKYEERGVQNFEYLEGLGTEAFAINHTNVLIRVGDGRYLELAVQLITLEGLPLPKEDVQSGLVEIGGLLLERG
jgi:hypothetical protein